MEPFLAARAAHIATADPGLDAARRLSEMTDEAVRDLARTASSHPPTPWALVALGGWGAGTLLPASDLDILVLSDASPADLKPFVEALLYPLWDAGLKVGHQVRSPKGQLRAMREDLATCTAALTGRPLAGDTGWATATLATWVHDAHRRTKRLLAELSHRARPGSPYLLEPDLKYGAGGRRDFDELVWRAAIVSEAVTSAPDALVDAGVLTSDEADILLGCAATVASARWSLQREGHGDRMDLDAAADLQMDPELVQRALAETATVLDHVRRRSVGTTIDTTPLSADRVFKLLSEGDGALEVPALEGRLEHLVPGFRDLMTLRRPGLGHDLTVGAHSIRAAEWVATPTGVTGALAASLHAIDDRRPLIVAALAHDAGKAVDAGTHAEAGAPIARDVALRFGLEDASDDVASLVRLHLVLAETATTVDLDDEDSVLAAAALIGDRHLLAPLHVLTVADTKATGPALWTTWLDSLFGALVARLDLALSPDVDGAGIAARASAVRAATLTALAADRVAERRFVAAAPLRYLASREPASIAADARLVAELTSAPAADAAHVSVSPGPVADSAVVTIAAADRPALFARLAGAIALAGLDILAADAYPAPDGLALDVFTVTSATQAPIEHHTFVTLERLIGAALRDRLELATRLRERRRHYRPPTGGRVRVETEPSGWGTTLKVRAPDRVGLLHDISRAVAEEGLDIRWAKALTVNGVAKDTFTVVGPDGGAVTDSGALGHLAMRVREAASVRQ